MKNNNENKIVASIEFYFKGERYTPRATIYLDKLMATLQNSHNKLAPIYPLLAKENGIDLYSYEFEIMLEEPIRFSEATGIATDYLRDGQFFIDDFEKAWHELIILKHIQSIAKQHLAIDDLVKSPDLKNALVEAFLAGKKEGENSG